MPTISLYPSTNAVDITGWTNPQNAYSDDASYATATSSFDAVIATRWGTFGADSALPLGAVINSVTPELEGFRESSISAGEWGFQVYVSGVAQGSENVRNDIGTAPTIMQGVALTNLTRANLLDGVIAVRVRYQKANVNTVTASLDFVRLVVDYTDPPPATPTGLTATLISE